jgi:hypothetical protein
LAWFSRLTFWTFILNPLLAPFGALVGCKLALAALALAASGIDSSGYFLQVIAWSLERYRDLICTLADFEYGGVELTGPPKWAALTAFSLGWLYLLQKHMRRYEQEFNLGAKLKIGANY